MPQRYLIAILLAVLWAVPFAFKFGAQRPRAVETDTSARWGIVLQSFSKVLVWVVPAAEVATWRIVTGIALGIVGILTVSAALRHLDRQWRLDAALNADHQLIRSGPYAIVRHPIYSSLLVSIVSTGLLLARWPALLAAIAIYIIGTEIRIRAEERLLRGRFGNEFDTWAQHVSAYVPYIR